MKVYTGTKKVQAQPMTRGDYNQLRGWEIPKDENPADEGYLVEYLDGGKANHDAFDGYISWSPRDVFERSYMETGEPIIQSDGPKVVYSDLIAMIESEVFVVPSGSTTTICHITLKNGFSVQGISACVDPANYRQNVGEFFARKQAIDKIWPFAGFLLADRFLEGLDGVDGLLAHLAIRGAGVEAVVVEDRLDVADGLLHVDAGGLRRLADPFVGQVGRIGLLVERLRLP